MDIASKNAKQSGGSFKKVNSMDDAFKNADIVYPKSWAPFTVMQERTELLKANDTKGLDILEQKCLAQNANFKEWECTEEKMKLTKNGEALYMHCLPADISNVSCEKGEVQDTVFDKYRVPLYKQAGYKPYIIASMMFNNKFKNPANLLDKLFKENKQRVKL
jgi:ornithine carbamoyltransferase